jgi:GNAT superfamily N-acetyltransferase
MSIVFRTVSFQELSRLVASLAALLKDCVDGGASLGFNAPLEHSEAESYWRSIAAELKAGTRLLIVAEAEGKVLGTGQLVLSALPTGRHRAELQKLCVLSSMQGKGIGRALMDAMHREALRNGRSLVVLNTRRGAYPESFYRAVGYNPVGVVPGYAVDRHGERIDTLILYRDLAEVCSQIDGRSRL